MAFGLETILTICKKRRAVREMKKMVITIPLLFITSSFFPILSKKKNSISVVIPLKLLFFLPQIFLAREFFVIFLGGGYFFRIILLMSNTQNYDTKKKVGCGTPRKSGQVGKRFVCETISSMVLRK